MTNVILLVKDRPNLTAQCLKTLYDNTPRDQFNLTIMDDGSKVDTIDLYVAASRRAWSGDDNNLRVIRMEGSISIVGWLRNTGASASERYFGRGGWVYFSDSDVAFFPGWLQKMQMVASSGVSLLGGCRHPFHGVNLEEYYGRFGWQSTDAVAGYSLLMKWNTFDKYGPFASNQKGVGASEDFALSRKIVEDGGRIGYIHPPVLAHTGIVNTDGKPATGADSFPRVAGILYE